MCLRSLCVVILFFLFFPCGCSILVQVDLHCYFSYYYDYLFLFSFTLFFTPNSIPPTTLSLYSFCPLSWPQPTPTLVLCAMKQQQQQNECQPAILYSYPTILLYVHCLFYCQNEKQCNRFIHLSTLANAAGVNGKKVSTPPNGHTAKRNRIVSVFIIVSKGAIQLCITQTRRFSTWQFEDFPQIFPQHLNQFLRPYAASWDLWRYYRLDLCFWMC